MDQQPRPASGRAPRPGPRHLVEVAPGVHVATAALWATTSTLVVDRDGGALVVDPGVSVAEVTALAATVRGRGWRVRAGFATHAHWDHVLWHGSLGDAPRWTTARAADALRSDLDAVRAAAEADAPGHDPALVGAVEPLPPGTTVLPTPGRTTEEHVRLVEHDAHSPGHAALVVRGVLVAGDMLSDVEVPLVDVTSADPVGAYHAALDALEAAAHDVHVLVPGHGSPAVGTAAIAARFAADRAYLDALERAVDGHERDLVDERLHGYVAAWHAEQLAALVSRRADPPRA
ncbi:MBL fold metallo-hydrolase [Cellulosimicrobium cellulans]|uniref:MBL fold metallo-hydrolase n=1 Tax=Cellulosimicrobium cellulans TaxID=1710 RepID=UPI000849688A|nr:MBL fold metallo-hydrolase [Cellulosimicrobium cellulans]